MTYTTNTNPPSTSAAACITRRGFLATAATTATVSAFMPFQRANAAQRPNIVVICADQMHWRARGAEDPFFVTPALDRLAREGVVFDHAYCATPQCSPSRASLYTGLYPHRTGVIGNLDSIGHDGRPIPPLPASTRTIGSRLGEAGYRTGYFGKWHLGNSEVFKTHFTESDLDGDAHDGATDKALAFLEKTGDGAPFALFVNYINPHDVYDFVFKSEERPPVPLGLMVPHPASWTEDFEGKPACQERFMREDQGRSIWGQPDGVWEQYRCYYREKCRLLDAEVGHLLDALDRLDLADETIVVFTSDHGDMDTHHRIVFKGPFMYEQLIHVPLIMRPPRASGGQPGMRRQEMVSLVDVAPTLCACAEIPADGMDGQLLPPMAPSRGQIIIQYYNKQKWVNPIRSLRTDKWKYNSHIGNMDELYDLNDDPGEMRNLAEDPAYATDLSAMRNILALWMTAHDDTAFDTLRSTDREGVPL